MMSFYSHAIGNKLNVQGQSFPTSPCSSVRFPHPDSQWSNYMKIHKHWDTFLSHCICRKTWCHYSMTPLPKMCCPPSSMTCRAQVQGQWLRAPFQLLPIHQAKLSSTKLYTLPQTTLNIPTGSPLSPCPPISVSLPVKSLKCLHPLLYALPHLHLPLYVSPCPLALVLPFLP